jgi:hypothetical protein
MLVIFIAIDPFELKPLRDFGSEADLPPPKGGNYLQVNAQCTDQ